MDQEQREVLLLQNQRKAGKGWLTLEGKKYYLGNSGARVTGEQFIKGRWYYFDRKGVYHPEKKPDNQVNPNKPMLALTFDDGPSPFTERLLRCLKQNNARATFLWLAAVSETILSQ